MLRPFERFLGQCISVSTQPRAFVRERIHLGQDVLHLSFHPIGAGIFTGAALALVASGVVALLVAVGYSPKSNMTMRNGMKLISRASLFSNELCTTVINRKASRSGSSRRGLQEPYDNLKPPIDTLSFLRPVITVLYLIIAAFVFRAATARRKSAVLATVLLSALLATGANIAALKAYRKWNYHNSDCKEKFMQLAADRTAETQLKQFAADMNDDREDHRSWDVSWRAEGRVLYHVWRSKTPITDMNAFYAAVADIQKDALQEYCSADGGFLRAKLGATETQIFYNSEGERLTGFSIGPADCAQW
jgi:hypothetical protein